MSNNLKEGTVTVISTYYSDEQQGARAEVVKQPDSYQIKYYDPMGDLFFTEDFAGKSVHYVEDAAENWALGIKQLNG